MTLPEGVSPAAGPPARKSAHLGDSAATEMRRIRARIRELDTEQDTLYSELSRLQRIARASGVEFEEAP